MTPPQYEYASYAYAMCVFVIISVQFGKIKTTRTAPDLTWTILADHIRAGLHQILPNLELPKVLMEFQLCIS